MRIKYLITYPYGKPYKITDDKEEMDEAIAHANVHLRKIGMPIVEREYFSESGIDGVIVTLSGRKVTKKTSARHLRGISIYLLDNYQEKYEERLTGERMFNYVSVPTINIIGNKEA